MYKKFDSKEYIDPQEIELFPFLEEDRSLGDLRYGAIGEYTSQVSNVGKNTAKNVGKVLRGVYYGALFFYNPMIVLLTQSRHILDIGRFIARNDKDSILLKFKSSHIVPKEINYAIDLFNSGECDRAITRLDALDNELEKLNEVDDRINLLTVRAQFEAREGRFLVAALDMIAAATLVESSVAISEEQEDQKLAHISAKGKYYFCAIMFLRKYAFIHGINDDLISAFKRFGKKAQEFFEYEADYREKNGLHNTGFYDLKFFKLPKLSFGQDLESAALNRVLASNVQKLQLQIDSLTDKNLLLHSIHNDEYKNNSESMFLVDILESIDLLVNDNTELSGEDICAIERFYNFCQKKIAKDLRTQLILSSCRFNLYVGKKSEAFASCMDVLDSCSIEEVDDVIYLFEKIRSNFSREEQIEIINYLIAHEKFKYVKKEVRAFYNQVLGLDGESDYTAKAFYPKSEDEFIKSISRVEHKNHYIRSGSSVFEVDASTLRALLGSRFIAAQENTYNAQLKRINYSYLKNPRYLEGVKLEESVNFEFDKKTSVNEVLEDICDRFYDVKGLESVRIRLRNQRIKVGVFGAISVGKSTFINALLGLEALGTDKKIATNVKTSIIKGDLDCAEVFFTDESKKTIKISEVPKYTTEQFNSYNKEQVDRVLVYLKDIMIPENVEIIDIPGMGAYEEEEHDFHVRSVESELDEVDCVLMLALPAEALNVHEVSFIKRAVNEKKVPFLLLVNRADDIGEDDREDLEESILEKLKRHEIEVNNLGFHFVSSIQALAGKIEDEDQLEYFSMEAQDCIEESGILSIEEIIYEELSPLIRKQKKKSILERTLYELGCSRDGEKLIVRDSLKSLEGDDEDLREEYKKLDKLIHQISSPVYFNSIAQDLIKRFELIDSGALIHKAKIDTKNVGLMSSNAEVYEAIYGPVYNEYMLQRAELVDNDFEEVKQMISIEIDRVKLKTKSFHEVDFAHVSELEKNAQALGTSAKAGNFFSRIINKQKVLEETSRTILEEIVEKDKKSYIRLLEEEISKYSTCFNHLSERTECLKKTLEMNELELKSLINELNISIKNKNKAINFLMELKDELCI
jgi:GTPase Era involved in 16S rRNA processing